MTDEDSLAQFAADAPPAVRDLARACLAFVRKSVGIDLDLTPDTLPLLDHYLSQARDKRGEVHTLVAAAAGAYFGELVRKSYPCRWVVPSDDVHDGWRLEFEKVFLYLHPVAIALAREALEHAEALEGGAGFSVREQDRPVLAATLATLGQVDEDEYYLLSTRFDVLSAVAERLSALRQRELATDELPTITTDQYTRAVYADRAPN
jgi:hypothetical protein